MSQSQLFINLVKSAKSEMLLLLPTINAFMREHRIGVLQLFKELSTTLEEGRARDIRILTPTNDAIDKIIEEMKITTTISTTSVPKEESMSPFSPNKDNNSHLGIRYLESEPELNVTTVTILVVDRKASLVIEKVDDSKESFIEAVGLSTYSTSEPTVISYLSIFENFWNQIELYQQVKEANERLTLHDKMQQEFINVAAHELRTPIQPILSTVGLIQSSNQALIRKEELDDSINLIARNATRLKQLSEDILDVTKIESRSLNLRKEVCDLNDIVRNSIDEYNRNQVIQSKKNIDIKYTSHEDKIFVEVDRNRIAQIISHLLSNAFKFTKEGSILVNVVLDQKSKQVSVSVKDVGRGIEPEVFPRLFQKFASKSFQGTGLGLFISRSIIEAHGGRIWAENNSDGKGATFYFTLPVIKSLQQPTYFM
jgi:two-component system, OmpR family, sensor histidine kinase VicK